MKRLLSDRGDAVMVTAVILLSLAVSVGGRLLISYGEAQGKEMDMEHISDVEDSLLNMRGSMYTLLDAKDSRTTVVNRLTLGTFGNPYLAVARSSGSLEVRPDRDRFFCSLYAGPTGSEILLDTVTGSIKYDSELFYFEDQDYYFEGGAIIIDESGYRTMSSFPSVELRETPTGWGIALSFYGLGSEPFSVSGIESISAEVSLQSYTSRTLTLSEATDSIMLRINSFSEQSWKAYFDSFLGGKGLVNGVHYSFTDPVDWEDTTQFLEVRIDTMQYISYDMGVMGVNI
ncbi:MAG: hypothetical protein QCI82_03240 [Candidatus Thermoplasmatota archaeon]|nr:hypothetical protein [Candidatus Thermoplasmatota archaeon]